jgi:hypothetical protein
VKTKMVFVSLPIFTFVTGPSARILCGIRVPIIIGMMEDKVNGYSRLSKRDSEMPALIRKLKHQSLRPDAGSRIRTDEHLRE